MTDPQRPARRRAPLPAFQSPTPPPVDPTDPTATTVMPAMAPATTGPEPATTGADVGVDSAALLRDIPVPRSPARATRTDTSDTSDEPGEKFDPKAAAALMVAVVGLGVTVAAVVVRRLYRGQARLRKPTDKQVKQFSTAVTEIGLRHLGALNLSKDLTNGLEALGAVGAYVEDGPLIVPDAPNPGLPAKLEREEEDDY